MVGLYMPYEIMTHGQLLHMLISYLLHNTQTKQLLQIVYPENTFATQFSTSKGDKFTSTTCQTI